MRNVEMMARFFIKNFIKNWKVAFVFVISPLVLFIGLSHILSSFFENEQITDRFDVALVDLDQTIETKYLLNQLENSDDIKMLMQFVYVKQIEAEQLLMENEVAAIIVLPKGFSSDVNRGINTPVKVVGNNKRPLQSELVKYLIESAAYYASAAQSGINTVNHFLVEQNLPKHTIREEFQKDLVTFTFHALGRDEIFQIQEKGHLFQHHIKQYYALSFFVLTIMIWSFMVVLLLRTTFENGLQMRLQSRGMTFLQLAISRLFSASIIVSLLSYLVGIPLFVIMKKGSFSFGDLQFAVSIFVITLVSCTFFLLVDSLTNSDRLYQMIGVLFIIVATIAGGHIVPTIYFPSYFEKLELVLFNAHSLKWLIFIMEKENGSLQIIVLLIIFSLSFLLMILRYQMKERKGG